MSETNDMVQSAADAVLDVYGTESHGALTREQVMTVTDGMGELPCGNRGRQYEAFVDAVMLALGCPVTPQADPEPDVNLCPWCGSYGCVYMETGHECAGLERAYDDMARAQAAEDVRCLLSLKTHDDVIAEVNGMGAAELRAIAGHLGLGAAADKKALQGMVGGRLIEMHKAARKK